MTNGRDRLEEWTDVLDDGRLVTLLRRLGRSQFPWPDTAAAWARWAGSTSCAVKGHGQLCRPLASPLLFSDVCTADTAGPCAFHKPAAALSEPLSLMTKAWLKLEAPCNSGSNLHMCYCASVHASYFARFAQLSTTART